MHGRAAHGSRPDLGVDAIAATGVVLTRLEALARALLARDPHPLLGTPSVHASVISGGQEFSSYPERCFLQGERRTLPGETDAAIAAEVAALAAGVDATTRLVFSRPPLETDPARAGAGRRPGGRHGVVRRGRVLDGRRAARSGRDPDGDLRAARRRCARGRRVGRGRESCPVRRRVRRGCPVARLGQAEHILARRTHSGRERAGQHRRFTECRHLDAGRVRKRAGESILIGSSNRSPFAPIPPPRTTRSTSATAATGRTCSAMRRASSPDDLPASGSPARAAAKIGRGSNGGSSDVTPRVPPQAPGRTPRPRRRRVGVGADADERVVELAGGAVATAV